MYTKMKNMLFHIYRRFLITYDQLVYTRVEGVPRGTLRAVQVYKIMSFLPKNMWLNYSSNSWIRQASISSKISFKGLCERIHSADGYLSFMNTHSAMEITLLHYTHMRFTRLSVFKWTNVPAESPAFSSFSSGT